MIFRDRKGNPLKTTMSDDIMNQIADLAEIELEKKGIFYIRNDFKFHTKPCDVGSLYEAQIQANRILIEKGVITMDMLLDDFKQFLK